MVALDWRFWEEMLVHFVIDDTPVMAVKHVLSCFLHGLFHAWADFCILVIAVTVRDAMQSCLACNMLHSAIGFAGGESRDMLLCVGGVGESRFCLLITSHKSAVIQHC